MQKLEPERNSLSGYSVKRETSLSATALISSVKQASAEVRRCSVCGCADQTVESGEVDPLGRKKLDHLVTIELRYLRRKEDLTLYLKNKGWRYKLHQARDAMERFICRPCLREVTEMERDWARKRDGERRQNFDNFYGVLCGE